MTDEIRARIAQTVYGDGDDLSWARAVELADLIIWELGLRRETVHSWNRNRSRAFASRYITEWGQP